MDVTTPRRLPDLQEASASDHLQDPVVSVVVGSEAASIAEVSATEVASEAVVVAASVVVVETEVATVAEEAASATRMARPMVLQLAHAADLTTAMEASNETVAGDREADTVEQETPTSNLCHQEEVEVATATEMVGAMLDVMAVAVMEVGMEAVGIVAEARRGRTTVVGMMSRGLAAATDLQCRHGQKMVRYPN